MRTVLSADATQFHATMRKAAMSAKAVGEKMGRSMLNASKAMGRVALSAGKAAVKIGMIGTAITAAFAAKGIKDAYDLGGALSDLSEQTGIAVRELVILKQAFEDNGVSGDKVGSIVNKMQRAMADLGAGLSTQVRAFDRLGLSYEDLERNSPLEQFEMIQKRIAAIDDPTLRAATAMEIFGRSGGEMLALFSDSSAISKATTTMGSAAEILDRNAQTFDRISDFMNSAGGKLQTFALGMAEVIAPMVLNAFEKFNSIDFAKMGQDFAARLPEVLDTVMEAVNQAFIFGQRMMQAVDIARIGLGAVFSADFWKMVGLRMQAAFLDAVNTLNRGMAGVIAGLQSALGVVTISLGQVFEEMQKPSFWSGLGNTLGGIAVSFAGKMAEMIANVLEKISNIPGVGKLLGGAAESTRELAANLSAQGSGMMEQGASGIAPMQKILKEAAENGAAAFGDAFTNAFDSEGDAFDTSKIKAAAANLAAPVADALADILNKDIKTLPDLVANVTEYANSAGSGAAPVDPAKQALMDKVSSHHAAGFSGLGGLAQMQLDKATGVGLGTTTSFAKDRARLGIGSGLTSGGIGAKRAVGRGKDEEAMKRQAELAKSSEEHLMDIKETIGKSLTVSQ